MLNDCHGGGVHYCTAIAYLQPSIIYADSPLAASPSPRAGTCTSPATATRPTACATSAYGGGYYLNQSNPAADAFFASYVKASFNDYDGLMVDDTRREHGSPSSSAPAWHPARRSPTGEELVAAHEQMAGSLTHLNGSPFLEVDNGSAPTRG